MAPKNNPKNPVKPMFSAKKSLGQNFLTDNLAIDALVEAVNPAPRDMIVEIGPGHGELTLPLLESGAKVISIEKDEKLADKLKNIKNLEVIEGDALKLLPEIASNLTKGYKLAGNIPYYITGFLLRTISELKNKPVSIVLTIQKEVAERICAKPGEMNLLAASVQFWGKPEIIKIVPAESFYPLPKVDSAVIRIVPIKKIGRHNINPEKFFSFIKILFKQPRKTIFNNLRGIFSAEKIEKAGIDPTARPQNLTIKDMLKLVDKL